MFPGYENTHRWFAASAAKHVLNGGCPYPIQDIRLDRVDEETRHTYIEMAIEGPTRTIPQKGNYSFTLTVELVATALRNQGNLYWLEQLQGWCDRLLSTCFPVIAEPFKYSEGSNVVLVTESGNGQVIGQAVLQGSTSVALYGKEQQLHRSAVTAVYLWETECSTIKANLK